MIVKDFLIKFSNIKQLHDRYVDLYPILEYYEVEAMSPEKYKECKNKFFELFSEFIRRIPNYEIKQTDKVIFVCKQVPMFFDNLNSTELNSWFCYKDDILGKAKDDFSMWSGDNRIEHYAYDMSPIDDILSAELYLYEVDAIDAACEIINEITFFGFEDDARDDRIDDLHNSLIQSVKEIESGEAKTISADVLFKELEEEILSVASDNEKIKIIAEREERERNKPRDYAYMSIAGDINHIRCIATVKSYYLQEIVKGNITEF